MSVLAVRKISLKILFRNCIFGGFLVICATSSMAAQTNDPACEFEIDCDSDTVLFDEDNCPEKYNPGQHDADNDGTGDACDDDTIFGYIIGDFKEGIYVNISVADCSGSFLIATLITDEEGYYAIGNLKNNWYEVSPKYYDYTFTPNAAAVKISSTL